MIRPRAVGSRRGAWTIVLMLLVLAGCQGAGEDNASEDGGDSSAGFSRLVLHVTEADSASTSLRRATSATETRQESQPARLLITVDAADLSPLIEIDCRPLPGPPPEDGFTGEITNRCTTTGTPEATVTVLTNTATSLQVEAAILIPNGLDRRVTVTIFDASGEAILSQGQTTVDVPISSQDVEIALFTETDLAITKTDAPDPIIPGSELTYTLTVTNNGPIDATGINVTDTLQTGAAFAAALPSQGSCDAAGGLISCALGMLQANASATITISVTVDLAASGILTNTAEVTADQSDPDTANNRATASTTINLPLPTGADLTISKTDDSTMVLVGDLLIYTLTVSNNGPSEATDVTVTDSLPLGFEFTLASAAQGTCHNAEGIVTCDLGTLPAGASTTVTIEGIVSEGSMPSVFALLLSGDFNGPTVTLINATPDDSITEFILTIGDTTRNFDVVSGDTFEELDPPNATFTLLMPDRLDDEGLRSDEVHYLFSGFEFGEIFSFEVDLDLDSSNTTEDYRQVLFDLDGSDESDNALVTVHYASGTTVSGRLPDFPANETNEYDFLSINETRLIVNTATVEAIEPDPNPENNSATVDTPVTLSGIAGEIVESATDLPVADITVQAFDLESEELAAETTTDADGFYILPVPPGEYIVGALGNDTLAAKWSGNAATFETAVPVMASPFAIVDFVLEPLEPSEPSEPLRQFTTSGRPE